MRDGGWDNTSNKSRVIKTGHPSAVLFYLLDRHAPLAMTKGSKYLIPHSLTTPPCGPSPPMEGNLDRDGNVTSSPLWRGGTKCRGGLIPTAHIVGNIPT